MKSIRFLIPMAAILLCSLIGEASAEDKIIPLAPIPSESRRLVMEMAGAFTKDGFKVRNADWAFTLEKKTPLFLRVTLFTGNHYWFAVASPGSGVTLQVTLYDTKGHPVKAEGWQDSGTHDGSRAASGIVPTQSGEYFVGVENLGNSTDLPLDCSLVMAYK